MVPADRRLQNLVERATALRDTGQYARSLAAFRKALAFAEKKTGPRSIETAGVLNHYGMLLKYSGQAGEAASLYRRALSIVGPARCKLAADLLHNLGGAEYARGNFSKGESYARRGIRVRLFVDGGFGLGIARDIAALAALVVGQGREDEAERMYALVLPVLERFSDGIHVVVVLNNLAALYQGKGRVAEAEKLYRRAIRLRKSLLGRHHPDLATTMNNLATLYKLMGRGARSAALYRRALTILKRSVDPSHPNLLACRENAARFGAQRCKDATRRLQG